jgi:uridine kinase
MMAGAQWRETGKATGGPMSDVVVIGVAGGTGSGKTTVADAIVARIGADRIAFLQHDSYYRDLRGWSAAALLHHNFDHPDALESELLADHVRALKLKRAIEVPIYDFTVHARTGRTRTVEPRGVVLVEGILIFAEPVLRELFDIKIFVDTDADLRFIRRLRRDLTERGRTVESVISQYLETVRPMHLEFVEPSKRWADLIIPEGGFNAVAMDVVCARVEALLQPHRA